MEVANIHCSFLSRQQSMSIDQLTALLGADSALLKVRKSIALYMLDVRLAGPEAVEGCYG